MKKSIDADKTAKKVKISAKKRKAIEAKFKKEFEAKMKKVIRNYRRLPHGCAPSYPCVIRDVLIVFRDALIECNRAFKQ